MTNAQTARSHAVAKQVDQLLGGVNVAAVRTQQESNVVVPFEIVEQVDNKSVVRADSYVFSVADVVTVAYICTIYRSASHVRVGNCQVPRRPKTQKVRKPCSIVRRQQSMTGTAVPRKSDSQVIGTHSFPIK
jgi:hypothetical protein